MEKGLHPARRFTGKMNCGADPASSSGREYNTVTTQLMQSLDRYGSLDGLLVMASTRFEHVRRQIAVG